MSVDRILEVLDGGLQRSPEPSYGQDFDQSKCVRCRQHEHAKDGDLCAGCRVFLLGDTDDDPMLPPSDEAAAFGVAVQDFGTVLNEAFAPALGRLSEAFTAFARHMPDPRRRRAQ